MQDAPVAKAEGNTKGRDYQAELWWAAVFREKGFETSFGRPEPDVIIDTGDFRVGIAAKRIKRESRLRERLSEGFKQLADWNDPEAFGVVGLDATLLANPDDEFCHVRGDGGSARNAAEDRLKRVLPEIQRVAESLLAGRKDRRLAAGVYMCGAVVLIAPEAALARTDYAFHMLHTGGEFKEVLKLLHRGRQ